MDWADDNCIVSYIAKDQQSYLDLLFALQENSLSTLFSDRQNGVSSNWLKLPVAININLI